MGRRSKQAIFQRRPTDGPPQKKKTHEKMFDITDY